MRSLIAASIVTRAMLAGFAGLVLVRGPLPPASADDKLPPAEEVLDRHVEAAGGKAAFEKLHNRVMKGTVEYGMTEGKTPFTIWQAEPCKLLLQAEPPGIGKILEGTDGETAWAITATEGPRIKESVERAEVLRQSHFNPELNWRRLWKRVETLGVENVGDKPAFKLELTPDVGKPVIMYFDRESGLCAKITTTVETTRGDMTADTLVSDYRRVDGVLLAHKQVQTFTESQVVFQFDSIEHNVELPKTKFELPVEIRQLQERKGGGR